MNSTVIAIAEETT